MGQLRGRNKAVSFRIELFSDRLFKGKKKEEKTTERGRERGMSTKLVPEFDQTYCGFRFQVRRSIISTYGRGKIEEENDFEHKSTKPARGRTFQEI